LRLLPARAVCAVWFARFGAPRICRWDATPAAGPIARRRQNCGPHGPRARSSAMPKLPAQLFGKFGLQPANQPRGLASGRWPFGPGAGLGGAARCYKAFPGKLAWSGRRLRKVDVSAYSYRRKQQHRTLKKQQARLIFRRPEGLPRVGSAIRCAVWGLSSAILRHFATSASWVLQYATCTRESSSHGQH
jgi:hypothetical protein